MKAFLNQPVTTAGGGAAHLPANPSTGQNNGGPTIPRASATKSFDITDIKQYFYIVVKRIWLVVLCFIIAVSATVILLLKKENVFQSKAVLEVSVGMGGNTMMSGGDYYAKQEELIRSQKIISAAQERLSLPAEEIRANLRGYSARANRQTGLITISVVSLDPLLSADLANAMAEEFIEFKSEQRIDQSQSTVISLTQQVNRLRDELRKSAEKRKAFERENNIVSVGTRRNVAADFLQKLKGKESGYRMERLLLESLHVDLAKADDTVLLDVMRRSQGNSVLGGSGSDAPASAELENVSRDPSSLIERGVVGGGLLMV